MEKSEVVTLMHFNSLGEAEIMKSLLESAGVECVLQDDLNAMVLPMTLVDVRLVVARKDEKRAQEILAAGFDKQEFEAESSAGRSRRKTTAAKTVSSTTKTATKRTAATKRCANKGEKQKKQE